MISTKRRGKVGEGEGGRREEREKLQEAGRTEEKARRRGGVGREGKSIGGGFEAKTLHEEEKLHLIYLTIHETQYSMFHICLVL